MCRGAPCGRPGVCSLLLYTHRIEFEVGWRRGEVESLIVQGYRRMTQKQQLERVSVLNRSIRALALPGIRQRHDADLKQTEIRFRLAALSIDRETMMQAFGWDPNEQGL